MHQARAWMIAVVVVGCGTTELQTTSDRVEGAEKSLRNAAQVTCAELNAPSGPKGVGVTWRAQPFTDGVTGGSLGTATLVRPNVILFCSHCLLKASGDALTFPYWNLNEKNQILAGAPSFVVDDQNECGPAQRFAVKRFATFGRGLKDIGIAQLASPVPANVVPFTIATSEPSHTAQPPFGVSLYGRGAYDLQGTSDHRLRRKYLPYSFLPTPPGVLSVGFTGDFNGLESWGATSSYTGWDLLGYTFEGDSGGPLVLATQSGVDTRQVLKVVQGGMRDQPWWGLTQYYRTFESFADVVGLHQELQQRGIAGGLNELLDDFANADTPAVRAGLLAKLKGNACPAVCPSPLPAGYYSFCQGLGRPTCGAAANECLPEEVLCYGYNHQVTSGVLRGSFNRCEIDANGVAKMVHRDCMSTDVSCDLQERACTCRVSACNLNAVRCSSSVAYERCELDPLDGCTKWVPHPCGGPGVCTAGAPQACACPTQACTLEAVECVDASHYRRCYRAEGGCHAWRIDRCNNGVTNCNAQTLPRCSQEYTAVTLVSFQAEGAGAQGINVTWETATELGTAGFFVYRADDSLQAEHVVSPFIPAEGDDIGGASYAFLDTTALPGRVYRYTLHELETSQTTNTYGPRCGTTSEPNGVACPVCANPCAPGTTQCTGGSLETCVINLQGCAEWQSAPCPSGLCAGSLCATCSQTCSPGSTRCATGGVQTCFLTASGCPQWSKPKPCATGYQCLAGRCVRAIDPCNCTGGACPDVACPD